jgi:phosphoribosylformylglycinamidine synthase
VTARIGVVTFPGSLDDRDAQRAVRLAGATPVPLWHADSDLQGVDAVVLPGGICNGFQVLCEAGLLPGALTRNAHLHFVNRDQRLRVESAASAWTSGFTAGQEVVVPVKNGEGNYVAAPEVLDELEGEGRVVVRYVGSNPNGSARDIAGIRNERGNVVGVMPHPEHAVEDLTGPGTDGLVFFTSVLAALVAA